MLAVYAALSGEGGRSGDETVCTGAPAVACTNAGARSAAGWSLRVRSIHVAKPSHR